ncbi:MAG TPA: hypothetical protein VFB49_07965 [Patescibacteria group bacterium]|nr:hypothetical protein [Patescibacteria group bacterium]
MESRIRTVAYVTLPALALALSLAGCAKDPVQQLSDPAVRARIVETLASEPAMRQELVDRLVGAPATRAEVIDRVLKDETSAGDLVQRILAADRGKALVVSKVTADAGGAKSFIKMLMLTGVMGTVITQKQADAYGLGDAYAYGNRKRTMTDLKKIGAVIDTWSRTHEGHYPECYDFADLSTCLARRLPAKSLDGLPQRDAWGGPIQYRSDREGNEYTLLSYATDGRWDGLGKVGPTDGFDCDIVFSNAGFIQWPGSIRREDVP